jgi:hypothetical protein
MALWQYEMVAIPRGAIRSAFGETKESLSATEVDNGNWWVQHVLPSESELSQIVARDASWTNLISAWGTEDGNRIEVHHDETGVYEVRIRIDLRTDAKTFLDQVVRLAVRHDWVFWSVREQLLEPTPGCIVADIVKSDAYRFVRSPSAFFSEMMQDGDRDTR